ncbi:single-stranded DNA-binding protein [Coprobacillus sp. CAG:605]|jgi:single-strand DNA-binding protein|nr:single-stranded DNA-binding protein [Coprobacillus sp. CAG:605]
MNKVILIGRLTRDPEMRTTPSGVATTSFSIAVQRNYANAQGDREADFINCVAWRKQAENIAKYCTKGSQVAVDGRIQTRNYDAQDGTKRYVTEVIADNVSFLGGRSTSSESSSYAANNYNNVSNTNDSMSSNNFGGSNDIVTTDLSEDPYANMGSEVALSDDDLPF